MIEINLSPGATRKRKSKGGSSFSLGSAMSGVRERIRDPYMLAAVGAVIVAALAIGGLHVTQSAQASALAEREVQAVADSTRFAAVLAERRRAEAKRDSVRRQLQVIRSIDEERFVWPHIMDEVSRALPPYTWVKSIVVTTPQPMPVTTPGDTAAPPKDPAPMPSPLRFRIVGHTVDIQALTRFMKLLEASPYIASVQLARSEMAMVDAREVTEFQLDAQYEKAEAALLQVSPVSLSVR